MNSLILAGLLSVMSANVDCIEVTGTGTVSAVPDMATFNVGIVSTAVVLKDAVKDTMTRKSKVLNMLENFNIDRKDIMTSHIRIQPIWKYPDNGQAHITGYSVSSGLTFNVCDPDNFNKVLTAVMNAKISNINGPYFTVKDPSKIYEKARANAVKDAMSKANTLVKTAGHTLGVCRSISERQSYGTPRHYSGRMMAKSAVEMPVVGGERPFSVTVNMTFNIVH